MISLFQKADEVSRGQKLIFKSPLITCKLTSVRRRQTMEVLSGPLVDLTLMLRQTVGRTDSAMLFALLGLVLFVCVCLLLCQLIVYIWWKLRQADELSVFPRDGGAIFRPLYDTALPKQRSVGSQYSCTAQKD